MLLTADIYPGTQPDSDLRGKAEAFVALYCLPKLQLRAERDNFHHLWKDFPARYHSTAHGIAAACGKFGVIVSQVILFRVGESDKKLKGM